MSGAKDASEQEELLERNAASETESSSSSSEIFLISVIIATIVIALVPVYLLIATLLNKMRKRATRAVGPETEEESVGPSASMPLNYSEAGTSQTVMVSANEVTQVAEPPVITETVDEAPDNNDLPPFSSGCDDNVININLDSRTQHRHIRFLFQFNDPCTPCGGTGGQGPSNDDPKPPSFQGFFKYPPDGSDETSARVFFKGSVARNPNGPTDLKPLAPPPNAPSTSGQKTKALPAPFQLQTSLSSPAFQQPPQLSGPTPGPMRERDVEGGTPAQEISQILTTLVSKVDELEKTSTVGPQPTFGGNEPARVVHENERETLKRKSTKKLKDSEEPPSSSEEVPSPLPAEGRREPPGTPRVERRSPEKEEGAVKPKKSKLRTVKVFPSNEIGKATPKTTRSVSPPPAVSSQPHVSATPNITPIPVTIPHEPLKVVSVHNHTGTASPRQAKPLQTPVSPAARPAATTALPKPGSQSQVPAPVKLQQNVVEPEIPQVIATAPVKPQDIVSAPVKSQPTAAAPVKPQSIAPAPIKPQVTDTAQAKPEDKAPEPTKTQSAAPVKPREADPATVIPRERSAVPVEPEEKPPAPILPKEKPAVIGKSLEKPSAPSKPQEKAPLPTRSQQIVSAPVKPQDTAPVPVKHQDPAPIHEKKARAKETAPRVDDTQPPEVPATDAPRYIAAVPSPRGVTTTTPPVKEMTAKPTDLFEDQRTEDRQPAVPVTKPQSYPSVPQVKPTSSRLKSDTEYVSPANNVPASDSPNVQSSPPTNTLSEEPKPVALAPSIHGKIERNAPKRKVPPRAPQAVGPVASTHTDVMPSPRVPEASPEVPNGAPSPGTREEPVTPALHISPTIPDVGPPAAHVHTPTVKAVAEPAKMSTQPRPVMPNEVRATPVQQQPHELRKKQLPVPINTEKTPQQPEAPAATPPLQQNSTVVVSQNTPDLSLPAAEGVPLQSPNAPVGPLPSTNPAASTIHFISPVRNPQPSQAPKRKLQNDVMPSQSQLSVPTTITSQETKWVDVPATKTHANVVPTSTMNAPPAKKNVVPSEVKVTAVPKPTTVSSTGTVVREETRTEPITDEVPERPSPPRHVFPNIPETVPAPAQPSSMVRNYPVEPPQVRGPSSERPPEINRAGSPEMSSSDHHLAHPRLLPSRAVASIPVADPAIQPTSHVSFTAPPTNEGAPPLQMNPTKQGPPPPLTKATSKVKPTSPVPESRLPPKELLASPKISQRITNATAPVNEVSMTQQTAPIPASQNILPPRHKHPPKPLWIPSIPPEASRTHKPGPSARPSVAPEPSTSTATAGPSCPRPPSLLNERWITEHRCARRLRHKSLPPSWRWCKKVPPAQPPTCPRLPSVRFAPPTMQTQRNVTVKPAVVSNTTSSRDFAPAAGVRSSFNRPSSSDSRVIPTTSSANIYGPFQNFSRLVRGITVWPTCQPQYQSMSCSRICGRPCTNLCPPSPDDSPPASSSRCFPSSPASPSFSACYVSRSSLIYQPYILRQHQILHFYQRPTDLRQLVALPGRRLPFCTTARSTGRLMSLCKSPLLGKGTPLVCKSDVNSAIHQDLCATGAPQDPSRFTSAEEEPTSPHSIVETHDDVEMTDTEEDGPRFVEVQASQPSRQLGSAAEVKASSETRTVIINVRPQREPSFTSRVPYQTPLPIMVTSTNASPVRTRSRPLARSTPPKSNSRQQIPANRDPELKRMSLVTVSSRREQLNEPTVTSQQPSDDDIAFFHVGGSSPLRQEYPVISKTTATSTTQEDMHEFTVGRRQSATTEEVPDEPPLKRRSMDFHHSEIHNEQQTIPVGIVAGPSSPSSSTEATVPTYKGETSEVHSEEGSDSDESDNQALLPTAEGSEVSLPAPAAADSMLMLLRDETVQGHEPAVSLGEDKMSKPSGSSSFELFARILQNVDPQRNMSEYAGYRRKRESGTSVIDSEPSWVPVRGEILRTASPTSTTTQIIPKKADFHSHSLQDRSCAPKKPARPDYLNFIRAPNIKRPRLICNEELVDKTSGILASFSIDKAVLQLMVGKETDCAPVSSSSAQSTACCRTRSLLVIDNKKSCEGAPKAKEAEDVDMYSKKVKKK